MLTLTHNYLILENSIQSTHNDIMTPFLLILAVFAQFHDIAAVVTGALYFV